MCPTKQEFRKKNFTRKIKSTVCQVAEPIASSNKEIKRDDNFQKNPHERVNITNRMEGKKAGSILKKFL
ncbi:unnamed protein product [Hymenolepis diminuta]|uniref:Uncharacterized protein n=1 Tax=Hymenolepis diminuta TaxID=6216 RepID=A0A564Y9Q2_HYMDI|nr:unnamed protein product [Hymenolepis diminuta]